MASLITIERVEDWRSDVWDEDVPSRTGWRALCPVHGDLGKGWAYATSGIAQSVGTRHVRSAHRS